ncbi:MAG: transposase [Gemmatimonadota bacterium]|nr:transposase [Gemmatimonadota bacterium]
MSKKRRKFSEEFKVEAVKLVTEQGLSITEAAQDLGVSPAILGRWKKTCEEGLLGDTVKRREADELKALRKENKRLRMERDILKKATAYFAKESQ